MDSEARRLVPIPVRPAQTGHVLYPGRSDAARRSTASRRTVQFFYRFSIAIEPSPLLTDPPPLLTDPEPDNSVADRLVSIPARRAPFPAQ